MNEARKYLENLSYEEQELLLLSLTNYANKKAKSKKWRTGNHGELPGGETPDSIVSLAIERVLTDGKRIWSPEKHPDFKKYLFDVIDSLLSHLATGKENRIFVNETNKNFLINEKQEKVGVLAAAEEKLYAAQADSRFEKAEWLIGNDLTAEEQLIAAEEKEFNDRVLQDIRVAVADDSELTAIIEAMSEGYTKPTEIEKYTGITADRIYNATKRLDRVVAKIRKQFDI